ncbi:MAG TPA: ATP-binding cassette domain-containing protein, partial [Nitriliruptorales bacterium]
MAARDATPALEVRQLSVDVHGIRAVHDVSLTVGAGERVGIIGESGCGKTVTALAVMGLLPRGLTASGSVRLDGQELLTRSERQRARIRGDRMSMIFQEP